ncbi:MAG: chitobiase/beta-hexosaminidase C-terminal domain-containing protein [Deltaproteobacteria bacterium]|nr:chitobiase/beta-hexosaminidase C-terminal domain-containing protein [Deltaproteobacteria bacterium]
MYARSWIACCLLWLSASACGGGAAEQVAAPEMDPPPGRFDSDLEVTLGCATPGAAIHYTTDGSLPGRDAPVFSPEQPIRIQGVGTEIEIQALAVAEGMADSPIVSGRYAVDPFRLVRAFPPVATPQAAYAYTFQATGGEPPYGDWRVQRGELPAGMSLDADSGELAGTAGDAGFSYFVLCASDAAGTEACELYGLRCGEPGPGPLALRAEGYQRVYEARHYTHGLAFNCRTPDDPEGNLRYSTCGDCAFQSGQCTQAMALRYAVTRSDEALELIRDHIDGWRLFQLVTGMPGLIGRCYAHKDWPMEDGYWDDVDTQPDMHRGQGEYADYFWKGDTSRDQVSGAVNGLAMAYDLVDDELARSQVRDFLVALADHVWDHGLKIVDPDGETTHYGDMDGETWEGLPVPNGMNAVCCLAWFKAAHHVSGEQRFDDYYRELAFEHDYIGAMRDHQWVYMGYGTKWYNVYLVYQNWFHLMRLEQDPPLRETYKAIFRDTLWLNIADETTPNRKAVVEANPVKTPWYLFSTGEQDAEALYEALWQVVVFSEPPLRDRQVTNSTKPEIEKNPAQTDEALYPLPSNLRTPDMVIWHRNPYSLDGGSDSGEERTGCDYLLPYWLGRYYGYIGPDW